MLTASHFLERAAELQPHLSKIRRDLHQHPELSLQETWTTAYLTDRLRSLGLEILPFPLSTGVYARLQGGLPGPTVVLRADIDALPIMECTGAAYASQTPGCMHACGHDVHMACILGAALLLTEAAASLAGTVEFLFQPAEETGSGAAQLLQAGLLSDLAISAIFALHCQPDLPAGSLGLRQGPLLAANDLIDILVQGTGGHGAVPHKAHDPILASAAILHALTALSSRWTDALDAAVITFGQLTAGTARNIIPETALLSGTLRTLKPETRAKLLPQIQATAEQIALAYGTTASVSFPGALPAVINPPELVHFCRAALTDLGVELQEPAPVMVTEDFALFQQRIPGALLWLGVGNPALGITHPLHSDHFDIDETALATGSAALAKLAFDRLAAADATPY